MRLYIAGPMTGLPDFNYPTFNQAERELRAAGIVPLNPTNGNASPDEDDPGLTWEDYLRLALAMVIKADGIALLSGWEGSRGARLEVHVAEALGMPVRPLGEWLRGAA